MFPKLYKSNETDFTHNGLGLLTGAISAIATEELNSIFELEVEYDNDGFLADVIDEEMIIKAKANDKQDEQLFRIYSIVKNHDNNNLVINAQHITYDLGNNFVEELKASSLTKKQVMERIASSTTEKHPFTMTSPNTTTQSSTELYRSNPLQMVAGMEGSILQIWGGQIERDNFRLVLHNRRGSDDGVLVTYAKNLTGLEAEFDTSDLVTRIYPFKIYTDDDDNEHLITIGDANGGNNYIDSEHINKYAKIYIKPLEFDDEDIEDADDLYNASKNYFENEGRNKDLPKMSAKVEFEPLWDTEEYKDLAALELVGMGDTITTRHSKLGIDVKANVNRIEFDVIAGKNRSVELGDVKANLTDKVNSIDDIDRKIDEVDKKSNEVIRSADGKNKNYYGPDEPTGDGLREGDLWFKVVDGEYTRTYRYDGTEWQIIMDMADKEIEELAEKAHERADGAYKQAEDSLKNSEEAVDKAQEGFDKAQENASEIESFGIRMEDAEDNITTITGTVEGLQTSIKDNEDNINTITQLAEGNLTKIENAEGDIATISERADSIVQRIENSSGNLLEHTDFDVKDNINDWYRWLSITSGFVQGTVADRKWLTVLVQGAEEGDRPRIRTPYRYHFKKGQTYTISWMETTYPEGLSVEPYAGIYVNGVVKDNFYNAKRELVEETETNGQKITVYRYTHTFEFSGEDDDECAIYIGKEVENPSMLLSFYFREMQLEKGEHRTPYEPNYKDSSTQIAQLADDISLRVEKGDVINQINISSEDILISGKKLILDGDTYVDGDFKVGSANIKDAAIGKAQIGDLDGANISSINIYGSYIEGSTFYSGDSNEYTEIKNSRLTARGQFKRTWLGDTTNYNVRTMLQNGYLRFRNDDEKHSLYFSEFGISTYVDGEGSDEDDNTVNGSSGSILWWDRTHAISDSNPKGITVNSYGGTAALTSTHNHVLLQSKYSTQIKSTESNIELQTHSGENSRKFRFTKSTDRSDGYLVFGTNSNKSGLRFSHATNGHVEVVDSDYSTGGYTQIEAGRGRFNYLRRRGDNQYINFVTDTDNYLRVGQDTSSTNVGRRVASMAIYKRTYTKQHDVVITDSGTLGRRTSSERYKVGIEKQFKTFEEQLAHSKNLLELDIVKWYDKREVENLCDEIEAGKRLDADDYELGKYVGVTSEKVFAAGFSEHVHINNEGELEGIDHARLMLHSIPILKNHDGRIEQLESENELLKARLQALEGK